MIGNDNINERHDVIDMIKHIPIKTLMKILGTKTKKPTAVEKEVEYHNTCRFCGLVWVSTSPANFVTFSDITKPIDRVFSHCDKCESKLISMSKEEIIRRALDVIQDKHITGGIRKW